MKFISRFFAKKHEQKEIRRPNLKTRIPLPLHEIAEKGVYRRLNPYSLDAITREFKGGTICYEGNKNRYNGKLLCPRIKKMASK